MVRTINISVSTLASDPLSDAGTYSHSLHRDSRSKVT